MPIWKCRLDEASLEHLQRELKVREIRNEIEIPGEYDLPKSHLRQVAVDTYTILARQENPNLERPHIHRVMQELRISCEPLPETDHG